jgi:asparaginyl-tRNA synthetase
LFNKSAICMIKLRAFLLHEARCWLSDNGYIEVQGPVLVPLLAESSNSLEVKYYDQKACLTKGFLPYGLAFAGDLGKVYTVASAFRKEQPSKRHLVEYWRLEVIQMCNLHGIIDVQERLIAHLCQSLSLIKEPLSCLGRSREELALMKAPFKRITYAEAVEMLQSRGAEIFWGQEISWEFEKQLSLLFDKPFFIYKFPYGPDNFFAKTDPQHTELSLCADLIAPEGFGELASSLQMITEKGKMEELLKEAKISETNRIWFIKFMNNCVEPSSMFALGIERLIQWILKLSNIKEATAFPRQPQRIYP